jgi:chemotaxis protein MotB
MNKDREVPVRIIIRKKRGGEAHHGGAWKVAFADFMTAMFALFLVLWLVNQSTDIRSAVAGYFQDPLGRADEYGSSILPGDGSQAASVRAMESPDVVELRRDRLARLGRRIREQVEHMPDLSGFKDNVQIELTEDGLRIQLIEDSTGVFFETGRSAPSPRGRELLAVLGANLGTLPNPVRIEGYTDARPYAGTSAYTNWELSADRANAARRILTASGVAEAQVSEIRGFADRQLRDPADPFAAGNRRITITMLFGDTDAAPAGDSTAAPRGGVPAVGAAAAPVLVPGPPR